MPNLQDQSKTTTSSLYRFNIRNLFGKKNFNNSSDTENSNKNNINVNINIKKSLYKNHYNNKNNNYNNKNNGNYINSDNSDSVDIESMSLSRPPSVMSNNGNRSVPIPFASVDPSSINYILQVTGLISQKTKITSETKVLMYTLQSKSSSYGRNMLLKDRK